MAAQRQQQRDVVPPELHLPNDPRVVDAACRCERAAARLRDALGELEQIEAEWLAISRLRDVLDRSSSPAARVALEQVGLDPQLSETAAGVRRLRRGVLRTFEIALSEAARDYRRALSDAARDYERELATRRRELQAEIAVEPGKRLELSRTLVDVEVASMACEVYRMPATRLTLRGRPEEVLEQALNPAPGEAVPLAHVLDALHPYVVAAREGEFLLISLTTWLEGERAGCVEVRTVCRAGRGEAAATPAPREVGVALAG